MGKQDPPLPVELLFSKRHACQSIVCERAIFLSRHPIDKIETEFQLFVRDAFFFAKFMTGVQE
jgi:hypothetical protein